MAQQYQIPGTPRIISPTPTPSEVPSSQDTYFAPITSSAAKYSPNSNAIPEEKDSDSDLEKRARARSRSPKSATATTARRLSGLPAVNPKSGLPSAATSRPKKKPQTSAANGTTNGHLSPSSAASSTSSYWRDFSRSPSPLGLIPIHRHWRSFIHRHEIPRKALHVSIGFFTLHLYARGVQTSAIHPYLLSALIPIATLDFLRHRFPSVNRLYVRVCGALMRESEVNDRYNGVIWYLLGAWTVMRFFPKDVAVMGVLLLSWCDTAASTVGRMYGRYTPRIRKGKSLAGSAAAALVGMFTAGVFWGLVVPRYWGYEESFMFKGRLGLPEYAKNSLGWTATTMTGKETEGVVGGWLTIGIMSLWSGFVASASEVVDLWGWDDNLTIPVLSGIGLWGFLKVFG